MQVINYPDMDQWLEGRMERIGGSDAPAVMRLDPWRTRVDAALEKLRIKTVEKNEAMEWGNTLEPIIRDTFRQRSGMLVEYPGPWTVCVHDEHRHMACSLDGMVRSDDRKGNGVLQVKNTSTKEPWDSVPVNYQAQIQHEMFVTGLDWAVVVALFGGSRLQWYVMERHPRFQELLVKEEADFWGLVKNGKVPEPDPDNDREMAAYARGMLDRVEGKRVELPAEYAALHEERLGLLRVKSEAEKRISAIKDRFQVAMGDAPLGTIVGVDGLELRNPVVRKKSYTVKEQSYPQFSTNKDRQKGGDNDA